MSENKNDVTQISKRKISPEQIRKFETYAAEIPATPGMDLNTDLALHAEILSACGV